MNNARRQRLPRWLVPLALALLSSGCAWLRGPAIPVWHRFYEAPAGAANGLVVLLPGVGDNSHDFTEHGFIERIQEVNPRLDVAAVDSHVGYYVRRILTERIHQDVVAPRRDRYQQIWFVGISLGGLGAISYAADYPHVLDGMVLLGPFLGRDQVIADVRAAGGVQKWRAPDLDRFEDPMRHLTQAAWSWAGDLAREQPERPVVFLGYGEQDQYAPAHQMLAEALPADRVRVRPGGHEWGVWRQLFEELAVEAFGSWDGVEAGRGSQ